MASRLRISVSCSMTSPSLTAVSRTAVASRRWRVRRAPTIRAARAPSSKRIAASTGSTGSPLGLAASTACSNVRAATMFCDRTSAMPCSSGAPQRGTNPPGRTGPGSIESSAASSNENCGTICGGPRSRAMATGPARRSRWRPRRCGGRAPGGGGIVGEEFSIAWRRGRCTRCGARTQLVAQRRPDQCMGEPEPVEAHVVEPAGATARSRSSSNSSSSRRSRLPQL